MEIMSADSFRFAREIGIGAAVTHRPLPHHRAYGSVHGGSIGYASSPRLTMSINNNVFAESRFWQRFPAENRLKVHRASTAPASGFLLTVLSKARQSVLPSPTLKCALRTSVIHPRSHYATYPY